MKVSYQRNGDAHFIEHLADGGHSGGGFLAVHRDANQLRSSFGKFSTLAGGAFSICCVSVGHGLHNDGSAAAHFHMANINAD